MLTSYIDSWTFRSFLKEFYFFMRFNIQYCALVSTQIRLLITYKSHFNNIMQGAVVANYRLSIAGCIIKIY